MFVRQTLLYLPAQVLAPAIAFATIVIWAHLLPPEAVGVATLVVAFQDISFSLFYMWWSHFVLRHLSRFRAGAEQAAFLRTEPVAIACSALLQLLVTLPLLWLYFRDGLDAALLAIIPAYLLTRSLNLYFAERARADVRIGLYTIMQVGTPGLGLGAGLLLVQLFGPLPGAVLGGFAIAQGLSLIIALADSDIARARVRPSPILLRQALAFGVPVMAASLLSVIALNAPRFIVDQTLGLAAAGLFAVGYGMGLRASSFAVMLVTAGAYPLVVRTLEAEGLPAAYRQLRVNILMVVCVVLPAALGLIAVNASLVRVLIPADFQSTALLVLPLSALGGMLRYLRSHTTDQVFLLRSRPLYSTVIAAIDLILAIGLSLAGVLAYGLAGAVLGPLAAAFVTLLASVIIAHARFDFRFPFADFTRIAIGALVMAGLVSLLPKTGELTILAAEIAIGVLLYAGMLGLLFPRISGSRLKAVWARAKALLPSSHSVTSRKAP